LRRRGLKRLSSESMIVGLVQTREGDISLGVVKLVMTTPSRPPSPRSMASPSRPLAAIGGNPSRPGVATRLGQRGDPSRPGFCFLNGAPSHFRKSFVGGSKTPPALTRLVCPSSVRRQTGA
jgi:hypothetical protein